MATCDAFDVTVDGDLAERLAKARQDIEGNGGVFTGDLTSGSVSGNVSVLGAFAADYTVSGNTVTFKVTRRPLLIPCSTIENKVREYFSPG
jgi:hypothetical protein